MEFHGAEIGKNSQHFSANRPSVYTAGLTISADGSGIYTNGREINTTDDSFHWTDERFHQTDAS